MNIKQFKHVGKVYCLNIGDSFYTKCGSILKVENKTFDYVFTLSNGKNYTPNQVYSLIKWWSFKGINLNTIEGEIWKA